MAIPLWTTGAADWLGSGSRSDTWRGLDAALGDRYVSEFYGVRPDVLLTLYVERRLWDRFLSRLP